MPVNRLLILTVLACCSCSGSAQERTATALNAIGAVVDPAYEAAMTGCAVREEAVMQAARRSYKEAYGIELQTISDRCRRVRDAFEAIRKLHNKAAALVEAGKVDDAQRVYGELLKAWDALRRQS
jgi:hypothetical protein